jgi:hypothetical protein
MDTSRYMLILLNWEVPCLDRPGLVAFDTYDLLVYY